MHMCVRTMHYMHFRMFVHLAYLYLCMNAFIYVYPHAYVHVCICMHACAYACTYACMRSYPQDPANTMHILRLQNCKDECETECGLVEVGKSGNVNVKEKNAKKCRPTVRELNTITL